MKSGKLNIASIYPFPFFIGEGHDTNFSLLSGNKIYSCEEGKINNIVNSQQDRFPEKSMLTGFKSLNIHPENIDYWVFGGKGEVNEKLALNYFFNKFKSKSYDYFKAKKSIKYVNHHLAHSTLAIYGSGFKDGIFLSLDNGGDETFPYDSIWGTFNGCKINTFSKYNKGGWGLSRFHNFLCETIGYLGNQDNGKVMGLAAYGDVKKKLYDELSNFLKISNDGFSVKFLLKHNTIRSKLRLEKLNLDSYQRVKILNTPNPPQELLNITKRYNSLDIAATGQRLVEDYALQIVKNMIRKTNKDKIVCSGGFFQNISFNKRLLDLNLNGVYIPPAPNDAGLSLGAALYVKMLAEKKRPNKVISPYLGPKFSKVEIEKILKDHKLVYKESKNICKDVAKLIKKGKIIGWFQGRSELGPRSLGARSVIADPRKLTNKAKINQFLKKRDWFMPYAPSILADKMNLFFGKFTKTPYMSFALDVTKNQNKIPAGVHVDGTSRPQAVYKDLNEKFYSMIKYFYKLTKVPAVLNTSFNRHGIATIVTPRNAIEHLMNECIDILAIEDFIVFKRKKKIENKEKMIKEKSYIFIEKLMHIINLINNKDFEVIKKDKSILSFLTKNKIKINLRLGRIAFKGESILTKGLSREKLWKILL